MVIVDSGRIVLWRALLLALFMHYFLNPSESGDESTANLIRFIYGAIAALFVGAGLRARRHFELIAYLLGIVCFWFAIQNLGENIKPLVSLYAWLILSAVCAMGLVGANRNKELIYALDILMIFWIFAFIFQITLYLLSGAIVDIHNIMHPLSEGRIHELGGALVRFTGVQTEPGTYANYLYGLALLRAIVNCNLFDRINLVGITSVLLSLSAWGMIVALIYLACHYISYIKNTKQNIGTYKKFLLAIILVPLIIYTLTDFNFLENTDTFDYFLFRSDLEDESGFSKVLAFESFLHNIGDSIFFGKPLEYNYCPKCISPQDAGIFINLTIKAGLIFCIIVFIFIGFVYFQQFGILGMIVLLPLLFSKFFYFDPLLWIIIFSTYIAFFARKGKESISSGLNLKNTYYEK